MTEQEWEQLLQIKTAGRDDSHADGEHHPYEPTDYGVLEKLANSGSIKKKDTLIDYGSGKGRVSIFMTYQTGCRSIGIEYDERFRQLETRCPLSWPMQRCMTCPMKPTAVSSSTPLPCTP